MPRNDTKFRPLQILVPAASEEDIKSAAKDSGKSVSDFIREAIEKHMAANNHPIELSVPSRGPRKAS